MPRPSQMPPAAISGTSVRSRTPCSSTKVDTSSGFLKPPPSPPSTIQPVDAGIDRLERRERFGTT
jgi:hypothetical protein